MNDAEALLKEYLRTKNIMQLATASQDGMPWACTVHFFADEHNNLYWASNTGREHSKQLAENPNAAVAIVVHENTPEERYVIGISMTGTAQAFDPDDAIAAGYIAKLDKSPTLLEDIRAGKVQDSFYRFTPTKIVLFDTKNFPKDPRQTVLNG